MTRSDIPEDSPQPDQDGETVDMRGAQGPIYKPSGPVEQHFGPEIHVTATVPVETELPSSDAIARHRAALRERLEAEARARWGGMAVYIQEEGATLPIEASPYQTGRLGPGKNLLDLLRAAHRLLVLGEPGSGKTVSLERLAWELCHGPEPVVPVLVPLFHYEGAPLAEWVRATLRETGHLRLDDEQMLLAFLGQETLARCFFLFDGLNEVPPAYRDRLAGELARWTSAHPRHPVVLTSRPQDELWRRLRADVDQAVVVQPIADEEARSYLVAHLGQRGEGLYARLDERLREMARTPLILWLIKEAGAAGESIPGNRGELHARFVSRMLRRDTDRRMDAEIPDRVKRRALTGLAYHLGLAQRRSCPRDQAVEIVAGRLGEEQAEEVVGACARHGLLAGDDPVWFAPHQTVQEHFAALVLQEMAKREWRMGGWARLRRSARRLFSGQEERLAALAADDWWRETFVQLAGLIDDADRLALEVARVNPWLAWWCVEEGREVTKETQEVVADCSIRLLESEQAADRRRAVAALARMRNERVVQPLFCAAADSDPDVAGLAVQALVEMEDAVRPEVGAALEAGDQRLRVAALRYLRARPDDILWAEIPEVMWNELLETDDRRRVVAALARMPDEQAVPSLLRAAADSDTSVTGLAVQGLLEMGEAARSAVEKALRDVDRRRRLGALRYLIERPDDRLTQPLFQMAADADAEIAELAAQALVEMGETVRTQALALAQQPEESLHRSGLAYLEALLGLPVVWVPPGPFLMGTPEVDIPILIERFGWEQQWYEQETPQHEVTLPGYWIGRYPVTVAHFRPFVEARGRRPADSDRLKGPDDHPVTNVTWFDALAFCRWLSEKAGLPVTLPSEAEWEKAARGTDGRIYPWGDEPPDETRCNFGGARRGTTPVGLYSPQGDSPYGCADMAGNVWEWTRSLYREYPYNPGDGREDMEAGDEVLRELRGGAFSGGAWFMRCAFRLVTTPLLSLDRLICRGFRVCVVSQQD
jgi:formylglycine-generating enzyme required for sulfatase activity